MGSLKEERPIDVTLADLDQGCFLGRGLFGEVRKVTDRRSGFMYALKIIPKETLRSHDLVEQLRREICILQELRHPNIVELFFSPGRC